MEPKTQIVPVLLSSGKVMQIEAAVLGGEEDVAIRIPSFEGVTEAIEEISQALAGTLKKVTPRKASIEFGVQVAVESGQLTAVLLKGSGQASLKITLEWGGESRPG